MCLLFFFLAKISKRAKEEEKLFGNEALCIAVGSLRSSLTQREAEWEAKVLFCISLIVQKGAHSF